MAKKSKLDKKVGRGRLHKTIPAVHIDLYRQLVKFNEACVEASSLLRRLAHSRAMSKRESAQYGAMLDELRTAVSQAVADHLGRVEIPVHAKAEKMRLKLERKLLGQ